MQLLSQVPLNGLFEAALLSRTVANSARVSSRSSARLAVLARLPARFSGARAGRPLLRGQEEDNAEHRRVRARVEHTFARMKNWKILRDCRQKGDGLHHAVQAVATMHNLALAV